MMDEDIRNVGTGLREIGANYPRSILNAVDDEPCRRVTFKARPLLPDPGASPPHGLVASWDEVNGLVLFDDGEA